MGIVGRLFGPGTTVLVLTMGPALAQQSPYTPAAGSAERRAIFDAMRKGGEDRARVFVVRHLKVADGWAWAAGEPRSKDGANRYEPESALLRREGAGWKVVARPCGEAECEEASERARIRAAFPRAPAGIFAP